MDSGELFTFVAVSREDRPHAHDTIFTVRAELSGHVATSIGVNKMLLEGDKSRPSGIDIRKELAYKLSQLLAREMQQAILERMP